MALYSGARALPLGAASAVVKLWEREAMLHRIRLTPPKGILAGVVIAAALTISPRTASGQSRGTLQASATVVQTQASVAGIAAAHQALTAWTVGGSNSVIDDASTVSHVRIGYGAGGPAPAAQSANALVVEIDYLKN